MKQHLKYLFLGILTFTIPTVSLTFLAIHYKHIFNVILIGLASLAVLFVCYTIGELTYDSFFSKD